MSANIKQIVTPDVDAKRKKNPNPYQFVLLIWDLFRGEKTDEKTSLLRENKIVYEYVPNNMTADFQVFDLIVS